MIVIFVSLMAAAIQMALLLLTARILGAGVYSQFSLIVAVAVFLSAILGEWLRMILARQGGSRRLRFRAVLLGTIRWWMLVLAAIMMVGATLAAVLTSLAAGSTVAMFVLATGVTAGGNILCDMAATFLRFTSTRMAFSQFAVARVGVTGAAVMLAALGGVTGPQAALVFGLSGAVFGLGFILVQWPVGPARRSALLWRLSPTGWSMASGTIGNNITLLAARFALGATLPPAILGGAFLAIDLATRATNVLGSALSTWGTRLLFNGAHNGGEEGARKEFGRVSAAFLAIWFSMALFGLLVCLMIPLFTLSLPFTRLYFAASGSALAAVFLVFMRSYLFDAYLAAVHRHSEVPRAALSCGALAAVCAAAAYADHSATVGAITLPAAVGVSLILYFRRNANVIARAIDRRAVLFAVVKFGLAVAVTVLVALQVALAVLAAALAGIAILDGWFLLQVYRRFVQPAPKPAQLQS